MRSATVLAAALLLACASSAVSQVDGPYKVLKSARVGGEGGWDYIYADAAGRRLYIPRGAVKAVPATDSKPAVDAVDARLTIFDLDTLKPVGEIAGVGGNGAVVDPASHHGFTSDHPQVSMFDTVTMKLIKKIDVGAARPDGIYFDPFNERVYVFSHPTKDATVIDAKDGTVLGTIDLGGVPEEGVGDGKGMLYVVMQDAVGGVAVVDVKAMKTVTHYSFVDKGGCNGLALDAKNSVLFAACSRAGTPPAPQPTMVVMSAKDGKILTTLPIAGGSDGATFNAKTMEAFSTQGNGTMSIIHEKSPGVFESEQTLQTMNGARTVTFDSKTGHLFTMSQERGPVPEGAPAGPGGRPAQGPIVPGSFTILMVGR
ncbi:hypothetical protein SAMN05421819_0297 [Bryocella elongata]|uniref:DNA-binding beta-propeller fold protein YncE n=1 Tax=Bryocella elongata TaxID=863522 RepID=A0A1H5SP37_9BACT|nr:hypothetical protein [Bryocella elongata]SEF52339.1 hypothetical protein SAMN05421819_0297 [Bryocella elongata]